MKFKREFKKDFKKKLATGGPTDPPFGSYQGIFDSYESGDIGLDVIKEKHPLLGRNIEAGKELAPIHKVSDFISGGFGLGNKKTAPPSNAFAHMNRGSNKYDEISSDYKQGNIDIDEVKKTSPLLARNLKAGNGVPPILSFMGSFSGNMNTNNSLKSPSNPSGQSSNSNSIPTPYMNPMNQFSNYLDGLGQGTMEENSRSLPQKTPTSSRENSVGVQSSSGGSQNNSTSPSSTASSPNISNINIGGASLPDTGVNSQQGELESTPSSYNSDVGNVDGIGRGGESEGGSNATDFLQYLPEAMNFATGVLGKDKTKPATQVNNRAVDMMPDSINVNPQIQQARSAYRAILSDPNASANQKLAAQAQLNNQMSQIYAQKNNQETQLKANKASIQARLDSQQSRYNETHRQDKMASEANLGIGGNHARQALTSASQKFLQDRAMDNQKDQSNKELLTLISSYPEAVQKRILEQLDING